MAQVQTIQTANELLKLPPLQVQEWLHSAWAGHEEVPEEFNWHGLAEEAASEANPLGGQPNIEWAKAAVATYEKLAHDLAPDGKESFLHSAMNLRAALIAKLGEAKGHPVLDTELILQWFFESLSVSCGEAARQADLWRERGPKGGISMKELAELKRIKRRLSIIKLLIDNQRLTPDAELAKWLELRSKLP